MVLTTGTSSHTANDFNEQRILQRPCRPISAVDSLLRIIAAESFIGEAGRGEE
jgi:hypothetical protein